LRGNDFSGTRVGRAFGQLFLRGAISLAVCALVAVCVGGVLSVLAESLGSKAQTSDASHGSAGPCKASNCATKARKKVLGTVEEHKN
jgi:hypothetical protein